MDSLAEMIRQGIEAANKDLKRENDARLVQEVRWFIYASDFATINNKHQMLETAKRS